MKGDPNDSTRTLARDRSLKVGANNIALFSIENCLSGNWSLASTNKMIQYILKVEIMKAFSSTKVSFDLFTLVDCCL